VRSRSETAIVGETARLQCAVNDIAVTPVDWLYQPRVDAKGDYIISAGHLTNGDLEGRLNISGSTLVIENVTKEESGVYTCDEFAGAGKSHRIELIVQGWQNSQFELNVVTDITRRLQGGPKNWLKLIGIFGVV